MSKTCFLHQYDSAVLPTHVDDFLHKHDRTYVVLESSGEVAHIHSRTEEGVRIVHQSGKYSYWDYKKVPAPFERIHRQRQLFNYAQTLCLCTNNPERKYRTGFGNSTAIFFNVIGNQQLPMDSHIVEGMVKSKYFSLKEALENHHASALSPKWGLLKAKQKDKFINVLSYEFTPVGVVKEGRITIANDLFEEEVRDFFRQTDPDYTVKVKSHKNEEALVG